MTPPPDLDAVVSVTIPARPDLVHVLRSVTAGVAARFDLPFDEIDDLRIAVDEACAQLLLVAAEGSELTLRFEPRGETLNIVAVTRADGVWPPALLEDTMAWRVLSALLDEARFDRDGSDILVRMRKRIPGDGD